MIQVLYLKKHGVEFNALVTIHKANADNPLEVYRYLRDDLGIHISSLFLSLSAGWKPGP